MKNTEFYNEFRKNEESKQIRRETLRDVDNAFEEWFADPKQTAFYRISPKGEHWFAIQSVKNFAQYFAKRCGVVFERREDE